MWERIAFAALGVVLAAIAWTSAYLFGVALFRGGFWPPAIAVLLLVVVSAGLIAASYWIGR